MKQVIVLRKDLNMRKGKMVAQGAHASMAAILNDISSSPRTLLDRVEVQEWLTGRFKKICVSVSSEEELISIYDKAQALGVVSSIIKDSGLTEFGGVPTLTAVAVGPGSDSLIDTITGHLSLL